jgi:hypothetical protein
MARPPQLRTFLCIMHPLGQGVEHPPYGDLHPPYGDLRPLYVVLRRKNYCNAIKLKIVIDKHIISIINYLISANSPAADFKILLAMHTKRAMMMLDRDPPKFRS